MHTRAIGRASGEVMDMSTYGGFPMSENIYD